MGNILIIAAMILFGIGAGVVTAAGAFAIISSVGIINRIADVTNTESKIMIYEECIIVGVITGNILSLFDIKIAFGIYGVVVYGLLSGTFIGLFAACLAETIKALPVFVRRVRIAKGLGFIVIAMAAGKALGHLLYYLGLY